MSSTRLRDRLPQGPRELYWLLAVYLTLALAYWWVIPIWEAPDSIWHYEFAAHLASGQGLPTEADAGLDAPWRQQGSQPPLYYWLMGRLIAPIDRSDAAEVIRFNPHAAVGQSGPGGNVNRMVHGSWERFPWQGTVLSARLMGLAGILIFGLCAVLATWAAIRALFPERPAVALAGTAVFALNPEVLFFSGAISNDIAITAAGALIFWRSALVLARGASPRNALWLGVAGGIAMLSKLSGLWLLPPAGLALLYAIWRDAGARGATSDQKSDRSPNPDRLERLRRFPALAWRPIALFSLGLVGVAGWWYLRNWLLFGAPTGLPLMLSVMAPRPAPPGPRELGILLLSVWRSYWAVFGWLNVRAPDWVFTFFDLLTLLGLAGLLLAALRGRLERLQRAGIALAGSTAGLMLVALIAWAQLRYPQGRLALPAAPALAMLIGAGWLMGLAPIVARPIARAIGKQSISDRPARQDLGFSLALTLGLAIIACFLLGPVSAAYAPDEPISVESASFCAGPSSRARFGQGIELRSATVYGGSHREMDQMHPGGIEISMQADQELRIDLTWSIARSNTDRSVFIHLLDEHDRVIAQRDSYPQSGRLTTSDWHRFSRSTPEGQCPYNWTHAIPDPHVLDVPPTHATRCECRLVMGLYDPVTGERSITEDGQEEIGLALVRLGPAVGPNGIPNPMAVPFGERIELAGFEIDRRAAAPGESVEIGLFWRALGVPEGDYKVSVQLHDAAGNSLAQHDERPAGGNRHTWGWERGELIEDRHVLEIGADVPAGDYFLRLLLYEDETWRKLPVNWRDFELDLGPFTVIER